MVEFRLGIQVLFGERALSYRAGLSYCSGGHYFSGEHLRTRCESCCIRCRWMGREKASALFPTDSNWQTAPLVRLIFRGSATSAGTRSPKRSRTSSRQSVPTLWWNFVRHRAGFLRCTQRCANTLITERSSRWLIDPLERKVHIYRPGTEVERLDHPQAISGDPLLRGFVLNLQPIWD